MDLEQLQKFVVTLWVVGLVCVITFWGVVGYIAWHFISKLW